LGRWRTPLLLKVWRYGAGSIVAFVTSGVAFYVCIDGFGLGAITCSVIAFFAGLKYLAYDRFVFVDRRRSRSQVPMTTEQNLAP
jgi:hypothetical protein